MNRRSCEAEIFKQILSRQKRRSVLSVAWGERTDERMDKWTSESPPVFYRTLSPLGPLPKKSFKQFCDAWTDRKTNQPTD